MDDLRDRLTNWQGRKEAYINLLYAQPPQTDKAGLRTDAFDCVVCLVRVVYARGILSEEESHRRTQDNLLLAYAWRRFKKAPEGYAPEELEEHRKLKEAAIVQADGGSSFEELFTSSVMNRTLWSGPDMAVVRSVVGRNSTSAAWDFLPAPDADDPERRAENDLILLDRRDEGSDPNNSLEQHVNSFFEPQQEGHITRWDMASPPDYIRVIYYPNEDSPTFDEIQDFVLSMYDVLETHKGIQHCQVDGARYTLVGITRDQDVYDHHDAADKGPPSRVRLYADDGRLRKAASNHIIASDDWKMGNSPGYHYGLLYAHTNQMTLHPRNEFTLDVEGPAKRKRAMNDALKMLQSKDSTDDAAPSEQLLPTTPHPAEPLQEAASSRSTRPQGTHATVAQGQGRERLESGPSDRTLSSTSAGSGRRRLELTPRRERRSRPDHRTFRRSRSPENTGARRHDGQGRHRDSSPPPSQSSDRDAQPGQQYNRDPSPRAERNRPASRNPVGVPFQSLDMRRRDSFRDGEPPRRAEREDAGHQPSSGRRGRGNNHRRGYRRRYGSSRGGQNDRYH